MAGFSIVDYTGTGANNLAVPHGLSQAPDFMIIKCQSPSGAHFMIYHRSGLGTRALYLNLNNTWTNTGYWPTEPDGTNFYVGTDGNVNANGQTYVAYCWHAVPGYSAFPTYSGNNNAADGVFQYLGFSSAFNLFKAATVPAGALYMSSAESPGNPVGAAYPGDNTTVTVPGVWLDINSNGLKMRTNNPQVNASAGYILAAFAEHPFGGNNVAPVTAR